MDDARGLLVIRSTVNFWAMRRVEEPGLGDRSAAAKVASLSPLSVSLCWGLRRFKSVGIWRERRDRVRRRGGE